MATVSFTCELSVKKPLKLNWTAAYIIYQKYTHTEIGYLRTSDHLRTCPRHSFASDGPTSVLSHCENWFLSWKSNMLNILWNSFKPVSAVRFQFSFTCALNSHAARPLTLSIGLYLNVVQIRNQNGTNVNSHTPSIHASNSTQSSVCSSVRWCVAHVFFFLKIRTYVRTLT